MNVLIYNQVVGKPYLDFDSYKTFPERDFQRVGVTGEVAKYFVTLTMFLLILMSF